MYHDESARGSARTAARGLRRTRSAFGVSALLATALALSACGSTGGDGVAQPGELTTVKVGAMPIIDVAPLYLGIEKGFFEEVGLKIEVEIVQSGAASAAAVVSGGQQFGFAAPTPLIRGGLEGLPVRVIANAASAALNDNANAVVVTSDSAITTAAGLNGKTIGVNALGAADELYIRAHIDKAGGDSKSMQFVAVPFPNMVSSLKSGSIAAAGLGQPFLSASADDVRTLLPDPQREVIGQDSSLSVWFTSEDFILKNSDKVSAFIEAIKRSNTYAEEHPDEVIEIIGTFTDLTPEDIANAQFPRFLPNLHKATFERTVDLMIEYGFINKRPDLASLLAELK